MADYEKSYEQLKHKGIIPATALAGAGAMGLRGPSAEKDADMAERTRETSDLLLRMNRYRTIDCDCGTKLKVPPAYRESSVTCPHCGRVNNL